jgi:hypothetical protein
MFSERDLTVLSERRLLPTRSLQSIALALLYPRVPRCCLRMKSSHRCRSPGPRLGPVARVLRVLIREMRAAEIALEPSSSASVSRRSSAAAVLQIGAETRDAFGRDRRSRGEVAVGLSG